MGKILLTLETIVPDRDCIEIDKQAYALRAMDELSITQAARMRKLSQEIVDRKMGADTSEDDAAKLESYANDVLSLIIVELPADVRNKLTLLQKFQIVSAFSSVVSKRATEATREVQQSPPILEDSSRGSEGSTVEH